jgi:uncharacterized protein YbjT (DUF2867 family)
MGGSSSRNIAILGTSGHVGQATVKALSEMKVNATAFVRDPNNAEKTKDLRLPGITLKAGDMSDEAGTTSVLKGFDVVYLITPGHIDRTQITTSAIKAAKAAGVKHIVVVSVPSSGEAHLLFQKQMAPIEQAVKSSKVNYTILRLPLFLDNNFAHLGSIKGQSTIYCPQDPAAPFSAISCQDIGYASALILAHPEKHVNKTYTFANKSFTMNDLIKAFSTALGREIKYVKVDYPSAKQAFIGMGIPEWQTDGILELFQGIDKRDPVLNSQSNDFRAVTGRDATTVDQWVQAVAGAFK